MASWLGIDAKQSSVGLLLVQLETGAYFHRKVRSGAAQPGAASGLGGSLSDLLKESGTDAADIQAVCHVPPMSSETLSGLDSKKIGLLVTEGFDTLLHHGTGQSAGRLYGWRHSAQQRLPISMKYTRTVRERLSAAGDIILPMDDNQVMAAAHDLMVSGAEQIVVSLMHASENDFHEQRAVEIIANGLPHIPVFAASERQQDHEYFSRTYAAVLDIFLRTETERYQKNLTDHLSALNIAAPLHVARSDGGLMPADAANNAPLKVLNAGRGTSIIAARQTAASLKAWDAIVLESGSEVSLVTVLKNGRPRRNDRLVVASVSDTSRIAVPGLHALPLDLGTAQKSLLAQANEDQQGLPSLQDALVVLGRIPVQHLSAPARIDSQAAALRVQNHAKTFGWEPYQTAKAMMDLAEEKAANQCHEAAVAAGITSSDAVVIAGGGAGGLFGPGVAERMGCQSVVVPLASGCFSTQGMLWANPREIFTYSLNKNVEAVEIEELLDACKELNTRAENWVRQNSVNNGRVKFELVLRIQDEDAEHTHDFAYSESLSDDAAQSAVNRIVDDFTLWHDSRFGGKLSNRVILVVVRATASGAGIGRDLEPPDRERGKARDAVLDELQVYFGDSFTAAKLYSREKIAAGEALTGPAVLMEPGATIVVPPGARAHVDSRYNVIVELQH